MLSTQSGNDNKTATSENFAEAPALVMPIFQKSIWLLGIPSWLFGLTDRSIAAFADGYLSTVELLHLVMTSFFFVGWLFLKPEGNLEEQPQETESESRPTEALSLRSYLEGSRFGSALSRMSALRSQHLISQVYILPFPYLCQIYHLLNLKHLETVHSFSLNNLRVIKVSEFEPTQAGGLLKFQTCLESPFNILRIWRQPIVDVELVLHTPYTVELRIPVYSDKKMIVLFNAVPLGDDKHQFFIDIYSDLNWPKPILRGMLHLAACLTLFEDWSYLQKLANRRIERLVQGNPKAHHETMQLFQRFVDLYGQANPRGEPRLLKPAEVRE